MKALLGILGLVAVALASRASSSRRNPPSWSTAGADRGRSDRRSQSQQGERMIALIASLLGVGGVAGARAAFSASPA
jgi:hypothetical protein